MSFVDELLKLSQPAPNLPDLEDEDIDGTSQNIRNTKYNDDDDETPLRKKIIGISIADDSKYGGEKVSRADIFGNGSEMTGLADREGDDYEDGENSIDEEDDDEEEAAGNGSDSEEISNNEISNGISSGDEASEADDSTEEQDGNNSDEEEPEQEDEEDSRIRILEPKNEDSEKHNKKAEAVRSQLALWDQLIYIKIKLQSAIRAYNQLPRGKLADDLLKVSDEETKKNYNKAKLNAYELINTLLEAEKFLLSSCSFTKALVSGESGDVSDDEEIASSDDEDIEEEETENVDDEQSDEEEDEENETLKKKDTKLSWNQLNKVLEENDKKFDKFRRATLNKWDERTRIIGARKTNKSRDKSDFSDFEHSVVAHIDKIMMDKNRILKRTQTKRSDIDRIGADKELDEDAEIFDDDDFYQVLLKELVEKKTSNTNDPVTMTRHYIEMQSLQKRRAKKKLRDHRASKDRKIKYLPIPKLINFHPARPELVTWTHEQRNELYKSLFT